MATSDSSKTSPAFLLPAAPARRVRLHLLTASQAHFSGLRHVTNDCHAKASIAPSSVITISDFRACGAEDTLDVATGSRCCISPPSMPTCSAVHTGAFSGACGAHANPHRANPWYVRRLLANVFLVLIV
ncbi:hypothetical protein AURDEDRAFT_175901 [Auricularia subglabra TFB-10046 SS5]|uniref:Uncharacterized protein n=1 Tax=Auricularia subglabra (strain TFB-10046 / SS5) TaxID=717982 RepID=J0WSB3_AURST|nr:hypothetical protein AURDEDRAFT_175901 [Auricularia subglabra TFB-10046 SS5]